MSECVVRMEMPKRCDLCDFWRVCKNVADFGKARYFEEPRELTVGMKGCKIVCQLPEGHGRLIDADAAVNDIRDEILEYKMDSMKGTPIPTEHLWLTKNWIADEDICPTIVPAERSK